MKTVRSLGNVSLMIAVGGFVAVETALGLKWVNGPAWQILAHACEAATVGGMADWFAVTALFHEVPLPVVRRHTNIVVKNRARIVSGIANMVQNRWLSPDVIREQVARFSISEQLLVRLSDETRAAGILSFLRDLLGKMTRGIDRPEVAAFLDRVLKDQLENLDLARPIGAWLGKAIRQGGHLTVWETALAALEESMRGPEFRDVVEKLVAGAIEEYKRQGVRGVFVQAAEVLGFIKKDEVTKTLLEKVAQFVGEARGNPSHPLRERLDAILLDFADGLAEGRSDTTGSLANLQRAFLEAADTLDYIGKALTRLRETVDAELFRPGSDLDQLIHRIFREQLDAFRQDAGTQAKVDAWVRQVAIELVEERHAQIGVMVRGSLEKLSDLALVSQIEGQVGTDLQYIRLNGAIVGGLVGAILAIGKLLLL